MTYYNITTDEPVGRSIKVPRFLLPISIACLRLLPWSAGDGERPVRAVVEIPLETGPGLAGRVDLETDGPASVFGRVLNLDGELDGRAVLFAQLFARPLLELVPAVQQAALRVDLPVDAPVLRHQVPRLDGPAENGSHHVPLFVVRFPVQLGHAPLPLVAREIRPGRRQLVQLALHARGHRHGVAVLARHPRLGHFDFVLAEQRVLGGRSDVVHDRQSDQQHRSGEQRLPRRISVILSPPHVVGYNIPIV
ncbi:unnamed protein product [Aphis gossypii]|uniref:Uncharacterized protein n=1 Tax=Aphis gossypii TaxID=80765 RepID=A0A9P0NG46_APHGO|nr:unnamed protein product [Aphis gossypii]